VYGTAYPDTNHLLTDFTNTGSVITTNADSLNAYDTTMQFIEYVYAEEYGPL
jgi:hypothetical protein